MENKITISENQADSANMAEQRRYQGKFLRHLGKKEELEFQEKPSFIDQLSEFIEKFKKKKVADSAPAKDTGAGKMLPKQLLTAWKRHKRIILLAAAAVLLAILVIIIAPVVPLQIQRSAGFAAFEEQRYSDAFTSLQSYLTERPRDYGALYTSALAAAFIHDFDYAEKTIADLHANDRMSDSTIGYYYALFNFKTPKVALPALNTLLRQQPSHSGGRLLRGILLGQEENSIRQARDDFLAVAENMRNNTHSGDLELLHYYFQENDFLSLPPKPPLYRGEVKSNLIKNLGFYPMLNVLTYKIQYSNANMLRNEPLSPSNIVDYYFINILLKQNEMEEAASVLAGLRNNAPESLTGMQAEAIFNIYQDNYNDAKQQLTQISQRLPNDSRTLGNLSLIELLWVENDDIDFTILAPLYRKMVSAKDAGEIELGNSAYLALLNDDYDIAQQLLDKIDKNDNNLLQTRFSRAMLALVNKDLEEAKNEFVTISEEEIPGINRYLTALYESEGRPELAINALEKIRQENSEDEALFLQYAHLLTKNGDWRLAMVELDEFLEKNPIHYEARYLLGRSALFVGDEDAVTEQRSRLAHLLQSNNSQRHYAEALEGAFFAQPQGDPEKAAAYYFQAMNSAQTPTQRYEYAASWAEVYGDINSEEVVSVLRTYLQDRDSTALKSLLAYMLADNEPREAIIYAEEAAKLNHSYLVNLYAGAALMKVGIYASAVPLLEKAAIQQPTNIKVLYFLQQAYAGLGDAENEQRTISAINYLNALVRGDGPATKITFKIYLPDIKKLAEIVRAALAGNGDAEMVRQAYAAALAEENSPQKRADILYSHATYETYNQTYEKAADLFEQALALGLGDKERHINAMLFYARVLSFAQQYDKAAEALTQLMQIDGEQLLYRRLHAQALASAEQKEQAARLLTALSRDYPADIDTYYDLALVYADLKEYEAAIATLKKLLFIYPNHARSYSLLAELHQLTNNEKKARYYSSIYSLLEASTPPSS